VSFKVSATFRLNCRQHAQSKHHNNNKKGKIAEVNRNKSARSHFYPKYAHNIFLNLNCMLKDCLFNLYHISVQSLHINNVHKRCQMHYYISNLSDMLKAYKRNTEVHVDISHRALTHFYQKMCECNHQNSSK
jgi:hypothetical protein